MNVFAFIQASLKNIWVVISLSALLLIIGWILSRWIARIAVRLLDRTPLINQLAKRLKLSNSALIELRIQQTTRCLVILLSLWGAWKTLNSHPDLARFFESTWELIAQDPHEWASRVQHETSAKVIVLKPGESFTLP